MSVRPHDDVYDCADDDYNVDVYSDDDDDDKRRVRTVAVSVLLLLL